jgi:hypothetical protein
MHADDVAGLFAARITASSPSATGDFGTLWTVGLTVKQVNWLADLVRKETNGQWGYRRSHSPVIGSGMLADGRGWELVQRPNGAGILRVNLYTRRS